LIRSGEVEDGTVVRMPKAYPVYDQGYQENVAVVRRYLETFVNLQTIGRNGLHRYNNQDHSMLTGIYAARNILGERNDVWSVNTEMEYHEEQRSPAGQTGERLVPARIAPAAPLTPTPDELVARVFAQLDPLALGVAIGIVSGFTLFLMTTVLLLKGGEVVGPTLSLLGHYLPWFAVTWVGAGVGGVEAALGGFVVGYGGAWLRNVVLAAYASLLRQRANAKERRHLLDKV
jgi:hypothetical protein